MASRSFLSLAQSYTLVPRSQAEVSSRGEHVLYCVDISCHMLFLLVLTATISLPQMGRSHLGEFKDIVRVRCVALF